MDTNWLRQQAFEAALRWKRSTGRPPEAATFARAEWDAIDEFEKAFEKEINQTAVAIGYEAYRKLWVD